MRQQTALVTIDGETLMSTPLRPLNFIIFSLLSQGLHLLAGSPKVGKSWLALWLAVSVAKGEDIWGMSVRRGTTLYLCLEDSRLRIQNRLFEIAEDAPDNVHFCTEAATVAAGLTEQIDHFVSQHPDTTLIIIDTLQMVRGAGYDGSYAHDYRDLSVLKQLADRHGLAVLLVHHLRKELSDDVFNRISGTTGVQGAVDSSFTLIEERRGSAEAKLYCIGRDIEYREISLSRGEDNIWLLLSDTRTQPELLGDSILSLLVNFLETQESFCGTPTELCEALQAQTTEVLSAKSISRRILQNQEELKRLGVHSGIRRSNGKRLIELHFMRNERAESAISADSADIEGAPNIDPCDPCGTAIA